MAEIAVYAGSFDPPTAGHLDIVRRVAPLFKKLHLVVARNFTKKSLFSPEERAALLEKCVAQILPAGSYEVHVHSGLVVDFCKGLGAKVLVRGLRAMSDFEKELQISAMNKRLAPDIETLHVMTHEKYFFVSSTLVKEVASAGGSLKDVVPDLVIEALKEKLQ